MEIAASDTIKNELIKENQAFRELVRQHQTYEERLSELSGLTYPSEEEMLEETNLKKKKLIVKDEIYSMIQDYSKGH
ncbi:MAG: YdcH family protein [Acidobacteriota bacterium]|nr:YdcH family protein [Acidobacteriota bacterium]